MVTAIIPLKALAHAKGRLALDLAPDERRELATWMLGRVLEACLASSSVAAVLVVAGDEEGAAAASRWPVSVLRQAGRGLNPAIAEADALLGEQTDTLVVAADLPLIAAAELDTVCGIAPQSPAVAVAPSRDGGTGALLRRPGRVIRPAFGPGSAAAHQAAAQAAGLASYAVALPGLAFDVDTPAQLAEVRHLTGFPVAAASDYALGRKGMTRDHEKERGMPQGTIKDFDIETRTGSVILDNQDELPIDAEAFGASGLMELRLGQRVRFEIEGDGERRRVRDLNIVSM